MFSGGDPTNTKPGTRHFENEEQCKTPSWRSQLSQAAVFPVQNKVRCKRHLHQRYVVLIEQRYQPHFFLRRKVNPSGFWLLVISQHAFTGYPATPVPAPEDRSLL